MGTRHIIKVLKNGKTWISQYGQWDGYPTGQGEDVIAFLKSGNSPALERSIEQGDIIPMTGKEWEKIADRIEEIRKESDAMSAVVMQMFVASPFCRDAGAKALTMLAHYIGTKYTVISEPGGWEEYMYTIDYDTRTLKIEELSRNGRSVTYDIGGFTDMTEEEVHELMQSLENEWNKE